jgi:hypothetical protein
MAASSVVGLSSVCLPLNPALALKPQPLTQTNGVVFTPVTAVASLSRYAALQLTPIGDGQVATQNNRFSTFFRQLFQFLFIPGDPV